MAANIVHANTQLDASIQVNRSRRSPLKLALAWLTLPCLWPYWALLIGKEKWEESEIYKVRRRRKELKPPTVIRRKRSLSVPLRKKQIMYDQAQAAFFKLPAELRLLIYELVIGREEVDIILRARIHSYRSPPSRTLPVTYRQGESGERTRCHVHKSSGISVIPLLQTCRKLYSEAVVTLYSLPTFTFHNPQSFLGFAATILSQRLSTIKSLRLHFSSTFGHNPIDELLNYKSSRIQNQRALTQLPCPNPRVFDTFLDVTCQVISGMTGLKKLDISVARPWPFMQYWRWRPNENVFASLKYIRNEGLEFFEIEFYWPELQRWKIEWRDDEFTTVRVPSVGTAELE
ncbi:hypothetical protein K469DRAFT_750873 [Zopfia rhizophila CBS 207.26]|uniref:DUF7730 domain-containing protein n=1 Tax=Zopfia rhizophila CBS 207.26 TaxID=1314779 RepID=A0A6A6E0E9_9PEZI|nr:hypothetical protein K469DRAFT_750873 [Zopfia rhizophila CBS 207.26]